MKLESNHPVYRQLINHLVFAILEGSTKSGDSLPAVKEMSLEVKINPQIVKHAYQELIELGVVDEQVGKLIVTSEAVDILTKREQQRFLQYDIPTFRKRMRLLDIDPDSIDWNEIDQ